MQRAERRPHQVEKVFRLLGGAAGRPQPGDETLLPGNPLFLFGNAQQGRVIDRLLFSDVGALENGGFRRIPLSA